MSVTEGPVIALRASLCARTSLLWRLVSPSAGDWYFQHLEIKGTEDGNVEEEAVVNFRAYMDGLAAEELVKISLSLVCLSVSPSLSVSARIKHIGYWFTCMACGLASDPQHRQLWSVLGRVSRRVWTSWGLPLCPLENDFFARNYG